MLAVVASIQKQANMCEPSLLNFAVSDGATLIATRSATGTTAAPTLYFAEVSARVVSEMCCQCGSSHELSWRYHDAGFWVRARRRCWGCHRYEHMPNAAGHVWPGGSCSSKQGCHRYRSLVW